MIGMYSKIDHLLSQELQSIEKTILNPIERYEKMVRASVNCYAELKQALKQHHFADAVSEIHFFKNIHPLAISRIHYYTALVKYSCHIGSLNTPKEKKCHCKKTLKYITAYNANNQHFITYYKSSKSLFDEKYFLRKNSDYPFVLEDCVALIDKDTSTGYDLILARYLAYNQLSEFLLSEIKRFESADKNTQLGDGSVFLKWTGTKSELTELMYALYAKGSINNGQVSVTELVKCFEKVFQLDLGDVYRTFNEIKNRNRQTLFIDNLKKAFIEKAAEKEF
jgi:hypothetical protein